MTSGVNRKTIAEARRQRLKDQETEREIIQALMRTVSGRRWVWLRLEEAQVFAIGESLDHAVMAFEKGRRSLGNRLLESVTRYAGDQYFRMTQENSKSAQALEEDDDGTSNGTDD